MNYFILITLYVILNFSKVEPLKVEYASSKLPGNLTGAAYFYDGDDHIYLYGGSFNYGPSNGIIRFTISTEIAEHFGSMPTIGYGDKGQVYEDYAGDRLFFGGTNNNYFTTVFKFVQSTNTSSVASLIPKDIVLTHVRLDDYVYFFGGATQNHVRGILQFDMNTLLSREVGTLTMTLLYPSAVAVGDKAYLFGESNFGRDCAWIVDLNTMEITEGLRNLPDFTGSVSSVFDGKYIYLFGGYKPSTGDPTQAIVRLNPATLDSEFILLEDAFIGQDGFVSSSPIAVFVEKLNRIYYFGGVTIEDGPKWRDDIWYVDLNTLEDMKMNRAETDLPKAEK